MVENVEAGSPPAGSSFLEVLRHFGVEPKWGLVDFPPLAAGAQRARVGTQGAKTEVVSRATALWVVSQQSKTVREALDLAGMSLPHFTTELGLEGVEVAAVSDHDTAIKPTLVAALSSYLQRKPHLTHIGLIDLALAILQSALDAPSDGQLAGRLARAGAGVASAIEHLGVTIGELPSAAQEILSDHVRSTGSGPATPSIPPLAFLADRPLEGDEDDLLQFGPYADAIANLIDNADTDTPLTLAISAPWGAGKTSLANMVEYRLNQRSKRRDDPPHIIARFNAWGHDDAPHLGSSFAADVARQANDHRSMWRRVAHPLPRSMLDPGARVRRHLALLMTAVALVAIVVLVLVAIGKGDDVTGPFSTDDTAQPVDSSAAAASAAGADDRRDESTDDAADESEDDTENEEDTEDEAPWYVVVLGLGGGAAALTALLNAAGSALSAAKATANFISDPKATSATGAMRQVSLQLKDLIGEALHTRAPITESRRFVIFVDDLERCTPPRAIEVCQVASFLLGHANVVTVLLADMPAVAASAEVKYEKLAHHYHARNGTDADNTPVVGTYGRLFLQKMVQFRFDLPTPPPSRTSELALALLNAENDDEMSQPLRPTPSSLSGWAAAAGRRIGGFIRRHELALAATATLGGLIALSGIFRWLGKDATWDLGALGVIVACGIVGAMATRMSHRRTAARKAGQEQALAEQSALLRAQQVSDPEEFRKSLETWSIDRGIPVGLAEQTAERYFTDESEMSVLAQSVILRYLPPLPRSTKRVLNRLRFMLVIARGRGLLDDELTPQHLGKWIVLIERWPNLHQQITRRPELLSELENRTTMPSEVAPDLVGDPTIGDFLAEHPMLGPVAERLVYLEARPPARL